MGATHSGTTGTLWMDAAHRRWSLRRAAGESRWRLAWHMIRWLRLWLRQTQWLRSLDASPTLRQAAQADPRLYERWHRPYICRHFDLDTRRRIVAAHYAFVMQRFPARLRDRVLLGHGVRVATLPMEGMVAPVYVHLRKPTRGEAGELSLLLLTGEKDLLASCVLTFDAPDSLLVGAMRGAGPHTPFEATRAFVEGGHGLHPRGLLVSLVRELAVFHGLARIRAVATEAHVTAATTAVDTSDAFWSDHGGTPGTAGCHELPLVQDHAPCADGRRSRRAMQQRREVFRRAACDAFIDAFRGPSWQRAGVAASAPEHAVAIQRRPEDAAQSVADRGGLLAARW